MAKSKSLALKVNCEPSKDNCGASCYYQYVYFKAKKRVFKDPKPGDKVIFGTALEKGKIKHIGVVIAVNGKKITTVEGNKSNQVKKCSYTLGAKGSRILAFLRPLYVDIVTAEKVIAYAISQIGTKETGNNHNKYSKELDAISYYNTEKDPAGADWCAIFTDCCVYECTDQEEPEPTPTPEPPEPTPTPEPPAPTPGPDPIAPATDFNPKDRGDYVVTASSLNVRRDAGTDAEILGTLKKGTTVKCYGFSKKDKSGAKWLAIYEPKSDLEGYCASKYLQKK